MKKAKFTVGDSVWVYDQCYGTFTNIEIDHVKIDKNGTIFYNGRFDEEEVFSSLEESYRFICDFYTKQYKEGIKQLTEEYDKQCCKMN